MVAGGGAGVGKRLLRLFPNQGKILVVPVISLPQNSLRLLDSHIYAFIMVNLLVIIYENNSFHVL